VSASATRTDRDRPAGAGAASERFDRQPRAPVGGGNPVAEDGDDLAPLLAGISDDGRRMLGAIEASLITEFAVRIATARQQAPRHELAAMLAALKLAQRAALAAARQLAKAEIQGRRAAVMRDRRRPREPRRAHGNRGLDRGPR
jgi:hypothetical protein